MKKTETAGPATAGHTTIFAFLEGRPHTVGELIDYADAVPARNVLTMALTLGPSLGDDYRTKRHSKARLRRLVILGRLIERLTFEIEGIPKRRGHRL